MGLAYETVSAKAVFPGVHARTSLKHLRAAAAAAADQHVFPGVHARTSLKRPQHLALGQPSRRFSGRSRPDLIEAGTWIRAVPWASLRRFSGRSRPDLIEAVAPAIWRFTVSSCFSAEHWKHLRTTNPIESTFATVRHRTVRTKGCMSNATAIAMVFKLIEAAQRSWRRLDGTSFLPKVIYGIKFKDGIEETAASLNSQAEVAAA